MAKTENIQVRVTKRFKERFEKVAEYEGLNMSDIITIATKGYIKKLKKGEFL